MKEVTKNTIIGDILDICPDAAPLFWRSACTALAALRQEGRRLNRHAPFTAMIRTNSLKR